MQEGNGGRWSGKKEQKEAWDRESGRKLRKGGKKGRSRGEGREGKEKEEKTKKG